MTPAAKQPAPDRSLPAEAVHHASSLASVPPLDDERATADLLANATGKTVAVAESLLQQEFDDPGSVVRHALRQRGVTPHEWSDSMERFYRESDAFCFELAVWNNDLIKRKLRRWIARWLARDRARKRVLMLGDGIGIDGVHLARCGHDIETLELPGPTLEACRLVHEHSGFDVPLYRQASDVPIGAYDAIVCLDVLEHVPKPRALLEDMRRWLAPGGVVFVSSPFHLVDRRASTHLRTNLRYCGRQSLYQKSGYKLIDGTRWWAPLVLARLDDDRAPAASQEALRRIAQGGAVLATARTWSWPVRTLAPSRRSTRRWFGRKH